jgi:hypothetical protein
VGFALEQNTVREFDKTKRIVEVEEKEVEERKASQAQENMDDMVNRTVKGKAKEVDIAKLSRSEVVTTALLNSLTTP